LPGRTILVVDDNPENLIVLGELLLGQHKVRTANSGERALFLARQRPLPDLILLDVMMPVMSGYEVLAQLRADPLTRDIPVIFVTALNAAEDEQRGIELGAVDYVTKPLHPAIVLARVNTHLELKAARDVLRRDNAKLELEIARRMHENQVVQDVTIHALARLAEMRDEETGRHIEHTQSTVRHLARLARSHPRFAAELNEHTIALISKSAPLHDIGKVGIPDQILRKPGKLDAAEWEIMKTHAQLGADALRHAVDDTHERAEFLDFAIEIARSHHERWDGSGYPDGLAGEAIPLAARLMAIADVFDALISRRVYKAPMPFGVTQALMAEQRGRHFDPDLLDIFIGAYDTFCDLARRHTEDPAAAADATG